MSQIADVGVSFKMEGADSFGSRLKSLESQWKSFSGSMDKAPEFNTHLKKIADGVHATEKKISNSLGLIKKAAIGLMTAKAGSGLLDWALGNEAASEAKSFNVATMGAEQREKYLKTMSQLRQENKIAKDDLEKGVYQIDTANSGKPLEQSISDLETLPYYMKLTGKSFEESAKFVKSFYASFGDSLPIKEQATYAKDTLGQLMQVAKISKSDPQQMMEALGRLGALFSSMGLSQAHMFANVSSLTPRMGGSPERAATAITSILPRSSEIAQTFAKADYEDK